MALKICQIGGYKGSTAGDCAYIEYDESATQKKYILIDLGRDQMLLKVPEPPASAIERVILTHMHADHIGGITLLPGRVMHTVLFGV
jgi:glyoxylase-like metal-dependent hydrolase (beta-lactamase superfamily II)